MPAGLERRHRSTLEASATGPTPTSTGIAPTGHRKKGRFSIAQRCAVHTLPTRSVSMTCTGICGNGVSMATTRTSMQDADRFRVIRPPSATTNTVWCVGARGTTTAPGMPAQQTGPAPILIAGDRSRGFALPETRSPTNGTKTQRGRCPQPMQPTRSTESVADSHVLRCHPRERVAIRGRESPRLEETELLVRTRICTPNKALNRE